IVAEPAERLHQTLVGAVFLDHAGALGGGWEYAAHGEPGAAAKVLERHRGTELHRFDIVAAAVMIDQARGLHDLVERDAIFVIASIGAMHDESPDAAGPHIEGTGRGGEAVRAPPLRQVFWIGPGFEHKLARCVELAHPDDG